MNNHLLTNYERAACWNKHGAQYCAPAYTAVAAVEGPFKSRINWLRVAFAVTYVLAFAVILLDIFVWRA